MPNFINFQVNFKEKKIIKSYNSDYDLEQLYHAELIQNLRLIKLKNMKMRY